MVLDGVMEWFSRWCWTVWFDFNMFKINFSGNNKIWEITKKLGGEHCPRITPWLRACVNMRHTKYCCFLKHQQTS